MIKFIAKRTDDAQQVSRTANFERFERKYYLPFPKISFASHLLYHCCQPDRHYPKGTINSVYYDTADLECFCDSEEGNRGRNKVRIRWYDSPPKTIATTPVFLELKSKNGFASTKQRKRYLVPSQRLSDPGTHNGIINYMEMVQTLLQFGFFSNKPLQPVILISYQRLRFEDILTGIRVSLDWNIRSTLLSPQWNRHEGSLLMRGGVIETKGPSADIPPALQSMRLLETDWSRYSKYAACIESQLEKTGATGRFWPSGRVENLQLSEEFLL
jgi:hypothetical protein